MVNRLFTWLVLCISAFLVKCQGTNETEYVIIPDNVKIPFVNGTYPTERPTTDESVTTMEPDTPSPDNLVLLDEPGLFKNIKNSYSKRKECFAPSYGSCHASKYYSIDGSCNNLKQPNWGRAKNPYGRALAPEYADRESVPTRATDGKRLPNARALSLLMFGETVIPDDKLTMAAAQFGQVVAHDLSHAAGSLQSKPHPIRCCTEDGLALVKGQEKNPACFPILVPKYDPVIQGVCMNVVRTATDRDRYCSSKSGPIEQLNEATAYLDLSIVYGNSEEELKNLRAFKYGHMIVEHRHHQDFPPHHPETQQACDVNHDDDVCYLTGDVRANSVPQLMSFHIIFLREHNRLADALAKFNPHWDDEYLFQEARKINIAQYQQITYYEWLPRTLGRDSMIEHYLIYETKPGQYVNDYDEKMNAHVLNEFTTSAFRYLHNAIRGDIELYSQSRKLTDVLRLSDHFNRPAILEQCTGCKYASDSVRGLATQPKKTSDKNIDPEVRHHLFRAGRPYGRDLRAIDIQRGRDHGLGRYNDAREFCGFKRAYNWNDYLDHIPKDDLEKMKSIYTNFEDVDLTIGGTFEEDVEGSLLGPVFRCLALNQFHRTRVGDRLFFENSPEVSKSGFKRSQLDEIRKASLARLFCDNTCGAKQMQTEAFDLYSNENPLVACKKIPKLDYSKWKQFDLKDVNVPNNNEEYS